MATSLLPFAAARKQNDLVPKAERLRRNAALQLLSLAWQAGATLP